MRKVHRRWGSRGPWPQGGGEAKVVAERGGGGCGGEGGGAGA
jgi:hypothetical protein